MLFRSLADDTFQARVLTRGSSALFGLLHRPGEARRSLDDIDAGIAAAVTARVTRLAGKS